MTHIARDRWLVTKPNAEPIEVIVCPAQSASEMLRLYPGCDVVPA